MVEMKFFGGLNMKEIANGVGRFLQDREARLGQLAFLVESGVDAMTAGQWSSIRRLLDEALDHPKDRPAILAELRSRDPEICGELERLLTDCP